MGVGRCVPRLPRDDVATSGIPEPQPLWRPPRRDIFPARGWLASVAGRDGGTDSHLRHGGDGVPRHPPAPPAAPLRPAVPPACVRPAAGMLLPFDCIRDLMMNTRLRDLAMHPVA